MAPLGSLIPIFVSRRAAESSTMFARCSRVRRLALATAALVALLSATPVAAEPWCDAHPGDVLPARRGWARIHLRVVGESRDPAKRYLWIAHRFGADGYE
jgi:hypothetical protein